MMSTGIAMACLGAAVDIAYHLITDAPGAGHGTVALTGHLVTLLGMVITIFGLLGAAFRRRPVYVRPTTKGQTR